MTRLFLAGPPAGLKSSGDRLAGAGAVLVNRDLPAEPATAPDWADWMRERLVEFADADGVALLPDVGGSRGTALFCQLAHEMGLPVRTVPGWLTQLGQNAYMGRLLGGRP